MSDPRPGPGMLRHAKAAARRPVALAGKVVASVVGVALVSSLGIAAIAVADVNQNIQSKPVVHLVEQAGSSNAPQVKKSVSGTALQGEINMLLVGTDTREDQGGQFDNKADQQASSGAGNNDVTMLLHINAAHTAATVVSFPRDLLIPIPSCPDPDGGWYSAMSSQMLNTSLTYGGLACPVLTVEQLLGINDIDYAAEISFDGVAAMSDAVGGVPVCVASRIYDPYTNPALDLEPGTHNVKGWEALSFLRSRHGVDDGSDLARISNQQNFLSSLLRTITSAGTLSNPVKLYELAQAATKNMVLSDTLREPQTMVGMALALKDIPLSQITFVQYPVFTAPQDANRLIPDSRNAELLAEAIQTDQPVTLSGSTGRGTVAAPCSTSSPTPTDTATTPPMSTAPADGSTPTPTSTDVTLGSNAPGQTAAEQTCTKGVNGNY